MPEPVFLARTFFYGIADIPKADPGLIPKFWDATDDLQHHFTTMAVVQTMVCQLAECYRDVMAWAPLSKIVIGGGHGTPEIVWSAAKTAKIALLEVMEDTVRLGLMTEVQTEKPAARFYEWKNFNAVVKGKQRNTSNQQWSNRS